LAITFRADDDALRSMRNLFVKAVRFVGAGVGSMDSCTLAGIQAIRQAEVCLYDALMDPRLLDLLPSDAQRIDVGKRCGEHTVSQEETTRLIANSARRGRRVVRLKGGDPGILARLAEELELLDRLEIPYQIIPGVSSLNAATTGTGLLLTRRGVSRGFTVMTPRGEGGTLAPIDAQARASLPIALFMATQVLDTVVKSLIQDGLAAETPAAVVFDAGSDQERIIRAPLAQLCDAVGELTGTAAGLVIIGEVCRYGGERRSGALRGRRVLLTCSEALQEKASLFVIDFGGVAVQRPLIRLNPSSKGREYVRAVSKYDWLVITSPSAVRCMMELFAAEGLDLRDVPRLMISGTGTAAELRRFGLHANAAPQDDFGAESIVEMARASIRPGSRVLRLRSDKAGPNLAAALKKPDVEVDDCVLYENAPIDYNQRPIFDVVFFASASAVEVFMNLWSRESLKGKTVLAIGKPTALALERMGRPADLISDEATVSGAVKFLARWSVLRELSHERSESNQPRSSSEMCVGNV
jgi:uroporphyrinogen III methyltransferase / synthase